MGAAQERSSMPGEEQPAGAPTADVCAADGSLDHAPPGREAGSRRPRGWRTGRGPSAGARPINARRVAARRGAVTAVGGAVLVDLVLWVSQPDTFDELPTAFWVMAVLAVAVDARPYVVANRRASSVILPSICFTFGIVLAWGFVPALAVQLVAMAVAGVRMRQSARRALRLAVQHALALAAAAVVAVLAGLHVGAQPHWDDALFTVAAAAAWIGARSGLDALIARCASAGRRRRGVQRWGPELFATAALLLLGPVVLAAAQVGLALVPLVLLALHAVHRMVRSAGEYERDGGD